MNAKVLDPGAVAAALERMKNSTPNDQDPAVIMLAASLYAQGSIEWGMELTDQPGLMATTTNQLLVNTLEAGAPEGTVIHVRVAPQWQKEQS